MSKAQFLLFLISIIPLANCCVIGFFNGSQNLLNISSKFFPILFLMSLIGLLNTDNSSSSLLFFESSGIFSFGFLVDKMALIFLFVLSLVWMVFSFYADYFWKLSDNIKANDLKLFFVLIVAMSTFILISQNLLSVLFFYNLLLFICHIFAKRFLFTEESKRNAIFTALLYAEAVFLFFAVVATHKFAGQIDFNSNVIVAENFSHNQQAVILFLYLGGLFLLALTPFYLVYRQINCDAFVAFPMFFLGKAFVSLYVFIKLLVFIFGFDAFSKSGFVFLEWVILFNLVISASFLLFGKSLKSSFFYLLFHQFVFAIFAVFTFALFEKSKIYLPLISFSLSITLAFLCLSNFVLYVSKAEFKSLKGLFYDLKVTSVLLAFAILNLAGMVPALGMFEKFFLIKIIFQKELLLSGIIFMLNLMTLVAFAGKLFYSLLARIENNRSSKDLGLIKTIDYDSNLMLTALVVAIIIFLLPIIFQLKNGIFSL